MASTTESGSPKPQDGEAPRGPEHQATMDMVVDHQDPSPSPSIAGSGSRVGSHSPRSATSILTEPTFMMCDPEEPPRPEPIPYDPRDPLQNSYEDVRPRFEKECFKVRESSCFGRLEPGKKKPTILKQPALVHYYSYLSYYEFNPKTQVYEEKKFIDR